MAERCVAAARAQQLLRRRQPAHLAEGRLTRRRWQRRTRAVRGGAGAGSGSRRSSHRPAARGPGRARTVAYGAAANAVSKTRTRPAPGARTVGAARRCRCGGRTRCARSEVGGTPASIRCWRRRHGRATAGRLDGADDAALPLYRRVLALQPTSTEALEGREDALSELLQRALADTRAWRPGVAAAAMAACRPNTTPAMSRCRTRRLRSTRAADRDAAAADARLAAARSCDEATRRLSRRAGGRSRTTSRAQSVAAAGGAGLRGAWRAAGRGFPLRTRPSRRWRQRTRTGTAVHRRWRKPCSAWRRRGRSPGAAATTACSGMRNVTPQVRPAARRSGRSRSARRPAHAARRQRLRPSADGARAGTGRCRSALAPRRACCRRRSDCFETRTARQPAGARAGLPGCARATGRWRRGAAGGAHGAWPHVGSRSATSAWAPGEIDMRSARCTPRARTGSAGAADWPHFGERLRARRAAAHATSARSSTRRTTSRPASSEKCRATLSSPLRRARSTAPRHRTGAPRRRRRPLPSSATSTSTPSRRCMPSTAHEVATTGCPCAMLRLTLPLTPAP